MVWRSVDFHNISSISDKVFLFSSIILTYNVIKATKLQLYFLGE